MTDRELKRLRRSELLELLIEQTKETNRLKKELKEAQEQLNNRQIIIGQSGSIAEAALRLNDVFQAADRAAQQFLENIKEFPEDDKRQNEEEKNAGIKTYVRRDGKRIAKGKV